MPSVSEVSFDSADHLSVAATRKQLHPLHLMKQKTHFMFLDIQVINNLTCKPKFNSYNTPKKSQEKLQHKKLTKNRFCDICMLTMILRHIETVLKKNFKEAFVTAFYL
jgi:hypothetical protein